jgi:GntR family transcriptional repressor for pyruvate dehydrogenase complex
MKKKILRSLIPPEKKRLNENIVSQLKALIFSNQIAVGEKLPSEREIAERLNVSRVVVRESLRSLEQSGLIETKPGKAGGAFITHNFHKPFFESTYDLLSKGQLTMSHFFEARKATECFGIRLATRNLTPGDIERLKVINRKLLEELGDKMKLREHNLAFHLAIAEISRNPLIKLIVHSLLDLLNQLRPGSWQSSKFIRDTYKRHEKIIEAMRMGDVELCERLMALDTEYTKRLKNRKSNNPKRRERITPTVAEVSAALDERKRGIRLHEW